MNPSRGEPDTAELTPLPGTPRKPPTRVPSARVRVDVGSLSHRGLVRANNEDHFLVARFGRSLQALACNLPEACVPEPHEEVGYGMVVADGMGGMAGGEVASRTAIEALIRLVLDTPDWILRADDEMAEHVMERMAARFHQIDKLLSRQARTEPSLYGMGTTLTLACSIGLDLVVCHVGDSRAYLFRDGTLRQLTRDMTMAQVMMEAGLISPAEAATHRMRHILTQHIGSGGKAVAEVLHAPLAEGDRLLVCSDGLTDMVPEEAITSVLGAGASPQSACATLVELALHAGGRDNVTVVLADYGVQPAG
jgi:protein phosphatase